MSVCGEHVDRVFAGAWERVDDGVLIVRAHVAPAKAVLLWPGAFETWWMDGDGAPQKIELRDVHVPPWNVVPEFNLAWGVDGMRGRTWRERRRERKAMPRWRSVYLTLWDTAGQPLAPVPAVGTAGRNGGLIILSGMVTETTGITGVNVAGSFMTVR